MKNYRTYLESPLGAIEIVGEMSGVRSISFVEQVAVPSEDLPDCLKECREQLEEYFAGARTVFSLKLSPEGTAFQRLVWEKLLEIPCGETRSYRELAVAVGNHQAVRAVGRANGANGLNIVIPCHRVVGSDGSLTGYEGGLWRKEWLLNHERCSISRK